MIWAEKSGTNFVFKNVDFYVKQSREHDLNTYKKRRNKMRIFIKSITLVMLFSATFAFAQQTGYSDAFNGEIQVSGPPSFSFSQEDGLLHISVDKEPKKWQAVTYTIGDTINITTNPYLNLRLKTSSPFLLTAYIVDGENKNFPINIKINATNTFVTYYIDFSSYRNIDLEHITKLYLTPNGNAYEGLETEIFIDELKFGTDAEMLAGINGVQEPLVFVNSTSNKIHIFDLKNAENIIVTGGESSITNIVISNINNKMSTITFDCQSDFIGFDTLTVTSIASSGYTDNSVLVPIEIEGNYPPSMDLMSDMDVMVGDTIIVGLTGIHDGNSTIEQPLLISGFSNNQTAMPDSNIFIDYIEGETTAKLTLIPKQTSNGIEISVGLNDQYSINNTNTSILKIDAFSQYNYEPVIDFISDSFVYLENGEQIISLTGIGDGDNSDQNLVVTATSSDQNVITDADITLNYTHGNSTAQFVYTPIGTGKTTISLTITDDGGTGANNGNTQTQIDFNIEVGLLPLTGYSLPMSEFIAEEILPKDSLVAGDWNVEGLGETQIIDFGSFHGKDNVIKSEIVNKTCWHGLWVGFPEINVDDHRYLSYDIYFEGGDFAGKSGQTHCYFWDDGWDNNLDRNAAAAHAQRKTVTTGEWKTVVMDFRSKLGMSNSESQELDVKRIQKILINYASNFGWPFPVNNGTVYITNINIGSAVNDSLVPVIIPTCTVNPVADQTLFIGSGEQTITLNGISDGNNGSVLPIVTAISSDTTFIPNPQIGTVSEDGVATLTYQPNAGIGEVEITVNVSADGSNDKSINIAINVLDDEPGNSVAIELFPQDKRQTMRGLGAMPSGYNYLDLYADKLAASAIRIGMLRQVEPVNDNNDPNVLDLEAFDYDVFDFDHYRRMKELGVETFILTSFSPPAWMKRNLSVAYGGAAAPNYEDTDNILEPYYYDEFAESMVAVIKMFKARAGIDLYAISPQNEPAFCEPYASAIFSPVELAKLCAVIGERFEREGIATKIFMPEQVFTQFHYPVTDYIKAVKNNSQADKYTDIIATHNYDTDGIGEANPTFDGWKDIWKVSQQCNHPKELWMSESSPQYTGWNSALTLAIGIHGSIVYGNISLWTQMKLEGMLIDKGIPTSHFYTSKNYFKYIRPGAVRIRTVSDDNDIMVSSFIHETDKTVSTVIINKSAMPKSVTVSGATINDGYDIYTSAENMNFEFVSNELSGSPIALPAKSVTTLIGNYDSLVTNIEEPPVPQGFKLYQNYPNPFNPTTTIQYSLGKMSKVEIKIYNILGQKVQTLVKTTQNAGLYQYTFNASNFASGVYFYRLKTEHFTTVKKMLLLK